MWISQFFLAVGIGVSAYYFISLVKSFVLHVKVFVSSTCGRKKEDFAKKYGPWAVVTGATAGIGLAYAKALASRNMNVVLISCEAEDLKRIAAEIENEFFVESKIICVDFTSGQHVYEVIQTELKGLQIGILVNNVGIYQFPAPALEMGSDFMWNMVLVNCVPVIMMTKLVLPGMKENRRGAIVNVSSIVDLTPTPTLALYSATKAFVTVLTKALQFENRGSGVTIQILSPGAVNTIRVENGQKLLPDMIIMPSASVFVEKAISTLGVLDHTAGYYFYSLVATFLEMIPPLPRALLTGYVFSIFNQPIRKYLGPKILGIGLQTGNT